MFYRTYHRIAAVAVLGAVVLTGTAQLARAQAPEKKVKDQGEYDIYNQTLKDMATPAALIKDLDTWSQKYPDSDWKDDRQYYYITAYNGTNQPAKVLELGNQLMDRDLKKVFSDPKAGPQQILTILYLMSVNLMKLPSATPEQMAQGDKAAKALAEFVPTFFTAANKPAGTADAAWNEGKTTMEKVAKDTQMYIATKPGAEAMNRYTTSKDMKDCVGGSQLQKSS